MRSTVRCECGAVYDRQETPTLIRIRDPFVCVVCGRELEDGSCDCEPDTRDSRWKALEGLRFGDEV